MRGELAQIDLEAARTAMESTSANGRVIILGSVCSPATLPEESQKCSWCNFQMATFEHLAWRGGGLPGADSRPPKPDNELAICLANLGHAEGPPSTPAGLAGVGSGAGAPGSLW